MSRIEQINYVFETVSRRLPEAGIGFLMIGGHAVNHYGYTRATMDVDFMIAAEDVSTVRQVMKDAGFTNVSEGETVIFFSLPDSPVRVDFLPVDSGTLAQLLSGAVQVTYGGASLKVPSLPDFAGDEAFCAERRTSPPQRARYGGHCQPDGGKPTDGGSRLEAAMRAVCDRSNL
jgi:hypothetical protein